MNMKEGSSTGGFISTGSTRCQDCGNQAKKECVYMRCRTCCKSKGFQCQTHVKSTWVPLYRRRQKQQQQQQLLTSGNNSGLFLPQQQLLLHHHQYHHLLQGVHNNNPKRSRLNLSSSGLEDDPPQAKNFPAEVSAMATFHVVRVSSMVDPAHHDLDHHHHHHHHHHPHHLHQQYAYQTSVNIGGHVFKGILYDQGPDDHDQIGAYSSLGAADQSSFPPGVVFQQPNFVNLSSTACSPSPSADQRPLFNVGSSSSSSCPMFHYPPPSSANFMSGMQFFPNRKS